MDPIRDIPGGEAVHKAFLNEMPEEKLKDSSFLSGHPLVLGGAVRTLPACWAQGTE